MPAYAKKLHIRKSTTVTDIKLYTDAPFDVGTKYITLKDGSQTVYSKLVPDTDTLASPLRVRKGGLVYAVALNSDNQNTLTRNDLIEHWTSGQWTTLPGQIEFVLNSTKSLKFTLDIWTYQDDGPAYQTVRLIIDGATPVCEKNFSTGWNSGSGSDYTMTDAIWQARYDAGILYHNGVYMRDGGAPPITQTISLGAGTHTCQVQITSGQWDRARAVKTRTVTVEMI